MVDNQSNRLCMVTVNFNYASYLEDCMLSIINQRGFDRVDYIVMDGGSTDGSIAIIEKHADQLAYWQSEPDDGMYYGIEAGLKKSDAEIIGWLNSDDMLAPWALQTALDIFDQLPDVKWITSWFPMQARKDGLVMKADFMPGVDEWGFFNGEHVKSSGLPTSGWIVQDSAFWRRSLWDEVGGAFDHSLSLACDFELWARFIEKPIATSFPFHWESTVSKEITKPSSAGMPIVTSVLVCSNGTRRSFPKTQNDSPSGYFLNT